MIGGSSLAKAEGEKQCTALLDRNADMHTEGGMSTYQSLAASITGKGICKTWNQIVKKEERCRNYTRAEQKTVG